MIDFTSSLYLGMHHGSAKLPGWDHLSTGKPSALFESLQSKILGEKIARLQGLEAGCISTSTLHAYYDVYHILSQQKVIVFIDEDIYPVSKYGIEKLYLHKIGVYTFKHLDAENLKQVIAARITKRYQPVIFTDGWCPLCGRPAPLRNYVEILKPYGGFIIVDDTQATGIFGKKEDSQGYGSGGGGSVPWHNIDATNIICISSLAKGFGVPIASITGSKKFIELFQNSSQTREYSSPPGQVHLTAALHALQINEFAGDKKRAQLYNNVRLMKTFLRGKGIKLSGGIFPVQTLKFDEAKKATKVYNKLLQTGIKMVLTEGHKKLETAVTFIITSEHTGDEIEQSALLVYSALCKTVMPKSSLY